MKRIIPERKNKDILDIRLKNLLTFLLSLIPAALFLAFYCNNATGCASFYFEVSGARSLPETEDARLCWVDGRIEQPADRCDQNQVR